MATSSEKVRELVDFARTDRDTIGTWVRPLLVIPGVRGQIRELLQMPADQLDGILTNTIEFLARLRSDDYVQPRIQIEPPDHDAQEGTQP